MGGLAPFFVALGLAFVFTPVAAFLAPRFGLVDRPEPTDGGAGALKIHVRPVPVLGGAAVVAATATAAAVLGTSPQLSLLAATAVALAIGVLDDAVDVPPWVRIQFQIAAAVVLLVGGFRFGSDGLAGAVGLVVLVVACANAVNLVDGQDGLAGGLAAIAALALAFLVGEPMRTIGLASAGALVAFVWWNRPPARIFLGNGGAYAVGVVFAALAADVTATEGARGLVAAGTCLAIFAFELVTTVVRRLASGVSLAVGDRRHTYDVLADRLRSRTAATVAFWLAGIALAVLAALIGL